MSAARPALINPALAVVLLFVFIFVSGSVQANRCDDARLMINGFFENLPPQVFLCDETTDCQAYYLRGDSCAPPVILGILGDQLVADNASKLVPLQAAVRRFCPKPEVACAPMVVPFACVDNRCVEIDPSAPPPQQQATPAGQQQGDNTGVAVPEQPTGEPANLEAPAQTPQQTMPQEPPQEVIVVPAQ